MSRYAEHGFSLVEVLAALVISSIALMGATAALDLSSRQLALGAASTRAMVLAQSRLEAKRSVRWQSLLEDDLDHDGIPETLMKDDGADPDALAGDGIYTARLVERGVTVVWTIRLEGARAIGSAVLATINATASFAGSDGANVVRLSTVRANPIYVGMQ